MSVIIKEGYINKIFVYLRNTLSNISPFAFLTIWWCIVLTTIVLVARYYYRSYNRKAKAVKMLDEAITRGDTINCIKIIEKDLHLIHAVENRAGYTPFLKACLHGNTQLVKYMLMKGADISVTTKRGESAFYLAAYNRVRNSMSSDATCLHALYYAGADINLPSGNGYTPLQLAAMFGHTRLVKWLVSKGADVNVYPSPILLARSQGHLQTAHALLGKTLKAITQS